MTPEDSSPTPCRSQSPVAEALEHLRDRAERIAEEIRGLRSQLDPLLPAETASQPEVPTVAPTPPPPARGAIVREIDGVTASLDTESANLLSLMKNLEI